MTVTGPPVTVTESEPVESESQPAQVWLPGPGSESRRRLSPALRSLRRGFDSGCGASGGRPVMHWAAAQAGAGPSLGRAGAKFTVARRDSGLLPVTHGMLEPPQCIPVTPPLQAMAAIILSFLLGNLSQCGVHGPTVAACPPGGPGPGGSQSGRFRRSGKPLGPR